MKNKNKNLFKDSKMISFLRENFEREKMVSLKDKSMFLTFINSLSWRVVILSTMVSLKGARSRVKMINNFAQYLIVCNRRKGPDYVIAYLKASQLALSKFLAKQPVRSLMEINPDFIFPCLRHGLPKIIGPRDRVSIRHNNRKTIILWMSIFGIFRVLAGTYKISVSTITDPFTGDEAFLKEKSEIIGIPMVRALLRNFIPNDGLSKLTPNQLLPLVSASPSSLVS
jgi:hypothetical protein